MNSSSKNITFCLAGAAGKMGLEVIRSLKNWNGVELVSTIGLKSAGKSLKDVADPSAPPIQICSHLNLKEELSKKNIDILLDFTTPQVALSHALCAIELGVTPIIGTSGLNEKELKQISEAAHAHQIPALFIPNFSIGSALTMKLSEIAIQWMPNAEIIEAHHEKKLDAPSGTAIETARRMNLSRTQHSNIPKTKFIHYEGVRGGEVYEILTHSVRLNGLVAKQNISFGGEGETLEITHTVISRSSYMRGVELAILKAKSQPIGLTIGLDSILFQSRKE